MKIAVYCGSGSGNNPLFIEAAKELGEWIGKSGHSLVYGGGESGLMGEVSKAAKENGAYVTGVIPSDVAFIAERSQPYCDELIRTRNMSERKEKMLEKSDAFVALPGGMGTLDEISEAITLTKIGVFDKKAFFFNRDGYYNPLKKMFEKMIESDFMKEEDIKKVFFAETVLQIEEFLKKEN